MSADETYTVVSDAGMNQGSNEGLGDDKSRTSSPTFGNKSAAPLGHSLRHHLYRCPIPNISCIHCLGLPMCLTAADHPKLRLLAPVPFSSLRAAQPALFTLVRSPAIQTYPHRVGGPQRVQYRHQPGPHSTMRVITIDLIRRTLPELCNDFVDIAFILFKTIVGRDSERALNAHQAFTREEPYALAKLVRIAVRRGAVPQPALRLPGGV